MSDFLEIVNHRVKRFKEQRFTKEQRIEEIEQQKRIAEVFSAPETKEKAKLLEQLIFIAQTEGLSIRVKTGIGLFDIGLDLYTITICDSANKEKTTIDIGNGIKEAVAEALREESGIVTNILSEAINNPEEITVKVYL